MALFTDTDIVTLDDLLQYEDSLVQVASSHGINVDTKISLATGAVGDKLTLWLQDIGASDPQWLNRRLLGLSTVVVTSTLHRWLIFDSLSRFFAEAYNVQLNTRFQGKWAEYQQAARDATGLVFRSGLGIVYNALPRPLLPVVSLQSGSATAQAMFVQTGWIDSNGNEGGLSPVNGLILGNDSGFTVAMAEALTNIPAAATAWNVYASSVEDELTRQNSTPLAIGTTWQLPSLGVIPGLKPIGGQLPNFYIALSRQILRG